MLTDSSKRSMASRGCRDLSNPSPIAARHIAIPIESGRPSCLFAARKTSSMAMRDPSRTTEFTSYFASRVPSLPVARPAMLKVALPATRRSSWRSETWRLVASMIPRECTRRPMKCESDRISAALVKASHLIKCQGRKADMYSSIFSPPAMTAMSIWPAIRASLTDPDRPSPSPMSSREVTTSLCASRS